MEGGGIHSLVQENFALVAATVLSTGVVMYYLMKNSRPRVVYPVSLDDQSKEVEPNVRCSHFAPEGRLVEYYYDNAKTCYEAFVRGMHISSGGPCLGSRTGPNKEYVWQSYAEIYRKAQEFGSACIKHGQQANNETFIGIFATNCPEWVITEQACNMFSMVSVPLYDTLGPDVCSYIINQTDMQLILCDKAAKAQGLLQSDVEMPTLKVIVLIGEVTPTLKALGKKASVQVLNFSEMLELGEENLHDPVLPCPEDLATICYTSGTTGDPKGVMLTHRNLVSNVASVLCQVPKGELCGPDDVYISYLPLAHMFERICQVDPHLILSRFINAIPDVHPTEASMIFQHGARVGFFRGDVKLLTEDMQALKPTIFPTVPRLLNRIYDKVLMGVQDSKIKSFLLNFALSKKTELLKSAIHTQSSIWDKLVFHKVQKLLGGRLRFCIVGSAPISGEVINFVRCAFGCTVFEGYGQTECTAGASFTLKHEYNTGMVGPPLCCSMMKVVDVPDMNYFAKNGEGEVCVKGTNVMKGYFKQPEKTREAIDEDGWLHTGDIGRWLPNGTMKIIDRKKHIFKLAQGEYLAPEKIEAVYIRSPMVAQAFVDGNSLQTYCVGVLVPDPETLPQWAEKQGISGSLKELCRNEEVKQAIYKDIISHGKEAGLKGFEQVKQIYLHDEMFSPENGLLTPTFKSKRPALRKKFTEIIENLYTQKTM